MTPHLTPAVFSEPFLFLSGNLPFDGERKISASDITGQTRQVMANIADVLATHDLRLDDIVKATVWIKHAADFGSFDAAYAEALGDHRPARSTVVSDLVVPDALVEVEVLARRPDTARRN